MNKISIILALLFLCFIMTGYSFAQERSNYLTFKGGVFVPTDDLDDYDFDNGFNTEVAYGHKFTPNAAFEAGLGLYVTKADYDGVVLGMTVREEDTISVVPLTASVKGIIPAGIVEIYGGAGAGIYFATLRSELTIAGSTDTFRDSDAVLGFHVMAGVNFNINRKFFFGLEGRRIWTGEAEFEGTVLGVPVRPKTDLSGYTVSGQFGFRL